MIEWFDNIYDLYKWVSKQDVSIIYIDEIDDKLRLTYE